MVEKVEFAVAMLTNVRPKVVYRGANVAVGCNRQRLSTIGRQSTLE